MRAFIASLAMAAFCTLGPAAAADRVALVIGNGAYSGAAKLANPAGDATAMADKLKKLGFDVTLATDVSRQAAISAIDRFSLAMNGASIALFYFAGHGIQIGGQNFLLPTDVSVDSERALRYSAIDIQEIVGEMERRAGVAIAILDACRDNPFVAEVGGTRSVAIQRGLGPMRLEGRGAIIAYAAASGDVAADGSGTHSPFTDALLAEIDAPRTEVGLMFRHVAKRVIDATGGDQRPELLVRLVDEVYLNPAGAEPAAPAPAPAPVTVAAADSNLKRTAAGERFFGERAVRRPPWAEAIALAPPSGWRSAAAVDMPEAAGNDTYATAQPIPLAARITARIVPRGDADWYAIDVPGAGELRLDVPTAPPELDLYARIWDADHAVVADWQGAARPGAAVAVTFALPRAGRYWIETVDGNNDAESSTPFQMKVDFALADDPFEPNDSPSSATAIPTDASFRPAIYPRGDGDWYKLFVPEPGLLSVTASGNPATLDVVMRLQDLDGKVVRDWVGPPRAGGDTALTAELAEPGTYLIELRDGNNDAASLDTFSLAVSFKPVPDSLEPDSGFASAALVEPTGSHPIAIFPRGDADWLAFDIDHPGELDFSATNLPPNIDLGMRVWNSDRQIVRDWVGPPRVGGDVEGVADLPAPGRYYVEIVDGNNDQASDQLFPVALRFTPEPDQNEPNNGPATATPLTPGGKVLFNILPVRDEDWFRVETTSAGELDVVLDESPPNLDLYFRIWNADHQVIRDWVPPYRKGGVAEGFADLPRPGVYFIQVTDGNSDERSIDPATLSTTFYPAVDPFEPNDGFGHAAPLKLGQAVEATILPQGDTDWYALDAPAAGSFAVTVDNVDPALDVVVRLLDAEARVVGDWQGPPRKGGVTEALFKVPAAGAYRLQVSDGNNDARARSPYRLEVQFR